MRTQAEVSAWFSPILQQEEKVYRKNVSSFIRQAIKGEVVVTVLNGVQETQQHVKDDTSWVVCGRAAGEQYILTNKEFQRDYQVDCGKDITTTTMMTDPADAIDPWLLSLHQEGFLEYPSKRRIWAHQVNDHDMKFFRQEQQQQEQGEAEATHFIAPWGEPMLVELGDFVATTYPCDHDDGLVEVYRIERSAFHASYVECNV